MNSQELLTFLQSPQVIEQLTKLQVARDNAIRAQLSGDQAKMQEFESQYVALMEHYKNMCMTMGALVEERDFLKKQHAAIQSTRQEFESREAELARKLDENTAKRDLIMEKDTLKRSDEVQIQTTKEDAERIRELQEYAKTINDKYLEFQTLGSKVTPYQKEITVQNLKPQEQHAKELNDKDQEIQTLKTQLAASQEESTRKIMKLLEQHAKELNNKTLVIGDLETHLAAAEQQTIDKLKVLQEQHDKQIKGKDLEIQTFQEKLVACQEQHVKVLNDKDLKIQELETRLSPAEQQTVDKVMELTNENKRLSQSIRAERLCKGLKEIQRALQKKETLGQEKKEVVSKPTTQLHTELHTELGKLYMELQEAKKPQEALIAQLAAKDKEMEYLMEQNKAKMAAKDSEIQNLKEMIQGGDETNKNVMAKDPEVEATRDGQSE